MQSTYGDNGHQGFKIWAWRRRHNSAHNNTILFISWNTPCFSQLKSSHMLLILWGVVPLCFNKLPFTPSDLRKFFPKYQCWLSLPIIYISLYLIYRNLSSYNYKHTHYDSINLPLSFNNASYEHKNNVFYACIQFLIHVMKLYPTFFVFFAFIVFSN